MKVGYARVSPLDQNLDLQTDALKKEGCKEIFEDHASGAKADRDGLRKALDFMREGDTLVVWKLDRLGRSLRHLIDVINRLNDNKMYFKSVQESIDTASSGGKLIFHVFGDLAAFERDMIRERTLAGIEAARLRGKIGGRPKKMDKKKIALARTMHDDPSNSIGDICEVLNISKSTLYRYLEEE